MKTTPAYDVQVCDGDSKETRVQARVQSRDAFRRANHVNDSLIRRLIEDMCKSPFHSSKCAIALCSFWVATAARVDTKISGLHDELKSITIEIIKKWASLCDNHG
jgi:hypothetical protein